MAKKSINPKVIKEIKDYGKLLKTKNVKVEKLILFGSYAKGTQKPWSDIDLCVVSPQFGKNRFEERVKLMKLTIGIGKNIEPHPYSLQDLKDKWNPLAVEIKKYGIEIPQT